MHSANQFEVHYHIDGGEHTADAFILARAETEFIHLIREVSALAGIEVQLDAQALEAGGIRQIWKALGRNGPQISILLSLVGIVISLRPQTDQELVALQKEEAKLHIEALRREMAQATGSLPSAELADAAREIGSDLKVVRRRSSFYHAISAEKRISSVSYSLRKDGAWVQDLGSTDRHQFAEFVRFTGELQPEVDENATIGIISPVLKKGRYKWKGEYKGEYIEFWLQDEAFRESVFNKSVQFHSGAAIVCVLQIRLAVDEVGCLVRSGYYVKLVKEVVADGFQYTTEGARKLEQRKQRERQQMKLFE
jgi:hypothetical protein